MKLMHLARIFLVAAVVAALTGCPGRSSGPPTTPAVFVDPPRRTGMPLVWVAMPDSAPFYSVRATLVAELKKDFDVETYLVDERATSATFGARIESAEPSCVVLMDNPTLKLYRDYSAHRHDATPPPPAIVVMASFLEEVQPQLSNTVGVAYEVQGVTAFVNLRAIIEKPVSRVGVVHRPAFRSFIERQTLLAAKEHITLLPIEVPASPTAADVRNALRSLRTTAHVDALWVLNDNRLLRSAEFLEDAWRPETDALGVPIVVGVPALVTQEARFGTLAVLPDLDALGLQTANLVFEGAENNWNMKTLGIELPVSTLTVVNMRQVRDKFGLRDGAERRIDRRIE